MIAYLSFGIRKVCRLDLGLIVRCEQIGIAGFPATKYSNQVREASTRSGFFLEYREQLFVYKSRFRRIIHKPVDIRKLIIDNEIQLFSNLFLTQNTKQYLNIY